MQYFIRLLLFFLPICSLLSCTIGKRLHRPGYHIGWKQRLTPVKTDEVKAGLLIREAAAVAKPHLTSTDTAEVIFSHDRPAPTAGEYRTVIPSTGEQGRETNLAVRPDSIPTVSEDVSDTPERDAGVTSGSLGLLYPVVLLTCLIAGLIVIKTAPATGILLLSVAGFLFVAPFVVLLIGWMIRRQRAKRNRVTP